MGKTSIEWTDSSWSPITGCTRKSSGCDNCYSARLTYRLEMMGQAKYEGLTVLNPAGDRHFNGVVRCHHDQLEIPLKWKKPRKIFVNSMSDTFHRDVPFDFIDSMFAIMALCPQHTFQVLTKRPDRMAEYFNAPIPLSTRADMVAGMAPTRIDGKLFAWGETRPDRHKADVYDRRPWMGWPLKNVWLGTSVENQEAADERIPHLLRCPAVVRFLSVEPLLGSISFPEVCRKMDGPCWCGSHISTVDFEPLAHREWPIHWSICGGESGPGARPMHPDWARSIRDQCVSAGVPFHFKQFGEYGPGSFDGVGDPVFRQFADKQQWVNKASTWVNGGTCIDAAGTVLKNGGDFDKATYPVTIVHRLGKKKAGRILDGRTWDEFPIVHPAPQSPPEPKILQI